MANCQLPFGQTDISRSDLDDLVDTEAAARQLTAGGVSKPETQVRAFVDCLPELLAWLEEHGRDYPWRGTTDPWRVYIAEILLQRTRGDAVADVYDRFFEQFPDPESLYLAEDDEILAVVSSLGFGNQRTRTLGEVAELCYIDHDGSVPKEKEELIRPWRVGPYSAHACLLFAFGEPEPLVDANIARVVGRVFDYNMPAQPHKSDEVYELMEALMPSCSDVARAFTLALLDLGDSICTAQNPDCSQCSLNECCSYARRRQ